MKEIIIREMVETMQKKCNSRISINIKGRNDHDFSNLRTSLNKFHRSAKTKTKQTDK